MAIPVQCFARMQKAHKQKKCICHGGYLAHFGSLCGDEKKRRARREQCHGRGVVPYLLSSSLKALNISPATSLQTSFFLRNPDQQIYLCYVVLKQTYYSSKKYHTTWQLLTRGDQPVQVIQSQKVRRLPPDELRACEAPRRSVQHEHRCAACASYSFLICNSDHLVTPAAHADASCESILQSSFISDKSTPSVPQRGFNSPPCNASRKSLRIGTVPI